MRKSPSPAASRSSQDAAAGRSRRLRRISIRVALGLAVLLLLAAWAAYGLWESTPDYWERNERYFQQVSDNATVLELATRIESRVMEGLSAAPPESPESPEPPDSPESRAPLEPLEIPADIEEPVAMAAAQEVPADAAEEPEEEAGDEIFIPFAELNAWLRVKLEDWAAHKKVALPPEIVDPMLAEQDGRLVLAFRYEAPGLQQIVSVFLSLTMQEDGRLKVKIDQVLGGRLPLPVDMLLKPLAQRLPRLRQWADAENPSEVIFDPVGRHPGDETLRLRLTAVEVQPEGLRLQLVGLPRDQARQQQALRDWGLTTLSPR